MSKSPEYNIWRLMVYRCHHPKSDHYKHYGDRGIVVCDEWRKDFAAFFASVGPRPSKNHEIDRYPDNDGPYAPGNVRWASRIQQMRNTRRNRLVSIDGTTKTIGEWLTEKGIWYSTFRSRTKKQGMTDVQALTLPIKKYASRKR